MRRVLATLGLCFLTLAATSAQGQTRNPLVGAWKVTEIANPNSPPITNPQAGLYVFTQKHYSAVRLNGTKPLPNYASNDAATDAEKVASFNTIYVNSGTYAVNGNMVTLSPSVAKSAFAMEPGRTIQYEFTITGDVMRLVQKPAGPGLTFMRVE